MVCLAIIIIDLKKTPNLLLCCVFDQLITLVLTILTKVLGSKTVELINRL